jgi:hypothetical protein
VQLIFFFKKGCPIFAAHMEEAAKDKVESIEYHPVLKYFEYIFGEIPGFPPKRDIDFSIDLGTTTSLVSKTPYRMDTQ